METLREKDGRRPREARTLEAVWRFVRKAKPGLDALGMRHDDARFVHAGAALLHLAGG